MTEWMREENGKLVPVGRRKKEPLVVADGKYILNGGEMTMIETAQKMVAKKTDDYLRGYVDGASTVLDSARWVEDKDGDFVCSACGGSALWDVDENYLGTPFCPHCGRPIGGGRPKDREKK